MEAVIEGSNMRRAYDRVRRNRGAAGMDGMSVGDLGPYIRKHWPRIKEDLPAGRYRAMAVLGIEIPILPRIGVKKHSRSQTQKES